MRYLVIALLLAVPSLALAGDCPEGRNGPLTENTRATTQPNSTDNTVVMHHTGFGSMTAEHTAYPH